MIAGLLDHLWQSTLFAATISLLVPFFRKQPASVRYWLWFAASVKFLFPLALLTMASRHLFLEAQPAAIMPILSSVRPAAAPVLAMAAPVVAPGSIHIQAIDFLITVWAVGAVCMAIMPVSRWLDLRAMLKDAHTVDLPSPIPVKTAPSFVEPGLVGVWRPVILLPQGLASQLTRPELLSVLAHELAHLRRRDNLLATVHMLVATLFWFHPLIWWIGRRLCEAREQACDESVISGGADRLTYAESILKVCNHYVQSPLACASGISGADLETRLRAIITSAPASAVGPARTSFLLAFGAIVFAIPLAIGLLQSNPPPAIPARLTSAVAILIAPVVTPAVTIARIAMPRLPRRQPPVADLQAIPTLPAIEPVRVAPPTIRMNLTLDARTPNLSVDASTVCRRPQPLPNTRLYGPSVCLAAGQWEALRANHQDIGADGHSIINIDYDKQRAAAGYSCVSSPAMNSWPTKGPSCF